MPIVYSLVSRGKIVLAEYTATSGNFPTVTRVLLSKIPGQDGKMSYVYDNHVFHYVVADEITYLCMADESTKRRLAFAFLEDIRQRLMSTYGSFAKTSIAFALNEDFSPVLREQMAFFNSDPSSDNIGRVKSQIDEVKHVMIDNIDKVLERGERIELLVNKSETLSQQAFKFEKQSRSLKNSMCCKRVRLYLVLFFVLGLIVFFIATMACGGISFNKC